MDIDNKGTLPTSTKEAVSRSMPAFKAFYLD